MRFVPEGFAQCGTCARFKHLIAQVRCLLAACACLRRVSRVYMQAQGDDRRLLVACQAAHHENVNLEKGWEMTKTTYAQKFPFKLQCLSDDRMDQKKTGLPNRTRKSKDWLNLLRLIVSDLGFLSQRAPFAGHFWSDQSTSHSTSARLWCSLLYLLALVDDGMLCAVVRWQLDNTSGQNKNTYWILFLAILVQRGTLDIIDSVFFRKGHTHWKVDQLFQCIAQRIVTLSGGLFTPEELVKIMHEAWRFRGRSQEDAPNLVRYVTCVPDFSRWVDDVRAVPVGECALCGWGCAGPQTIQGRVREPAADHAVQALPRDAQPRQPADRRHRMLPQLLPAGRVADQLPAPRPR